VKGNTTGRPDRAAGLYEALNAICDRRVPLASQSTLSRIALLISLSDSNTAVQLSRKSGAVHHFSDFDEESRAWRELSNRCDRRFEQLRNQATDREHDKFDAARCRVALIAESE